jgi:Mg2+ and Co2+ transporter CorA
VQISADMGTVESIETDLRKISEKIFKDEFSRLIDRNPEVKDKANSIEEYLMKYDDNFKESLGIIET